MLALMLWPLTFLSRWRHGKKMESNWLSPNRCLADGDDTMVIAADGQAVADPGRHLTLVLALNQFSVPAILQVKVSRGNMGRLQRHLPISPER